MATPMRSAKADGRLVPTRNLEAGPAGFLPAPITRLTPTDLFSDRSGHGAYQGQRTTGGRDERIDSTLPPVFSPKMVPRS